MEKSVADGEIGCEMSGCQVTDWLDEQLSRINNDDLATGKSESDDFETPEYSDLELAQIFGMVQQNVLEQKDQLMEVLGEVNGVTGKLEELENENQKLRAAFSAEVAQLKDAWEEEKKTIMSEAARQLHEKTVAHTIIVELREQLRAKSAEVARLERVCDAFDDVEKEYRERIWALETENKKFRGVESPPRGIGLLQQAGLGMVQEDSDGNDSSSVIID
ncbi:unnamed protein product [Caenorhabditis sp. 36 PRJEB53466]|nr:unnamed protein product [Caenorhabditis sp. 36 PRJEB53466]